MNPEQPNRGFSLLLIDDDVELCRMMEEYFAQAGHRLECAYNGVTGLQRALERRHDLVLLDVMLPLRDGISVLQRLRECNDLPIILLTARVEQTDRIRGLDSGADDYIAKPFDADELLARIRAVLRRSGSKMAARERLAGGGIELDAQGRTARLDNQALDLTALEFDILELLMRSAGRLVSRDDITIRLLDRSPSHYDRALDVHVSRLRAKLGAGRNLIQTMRGAGYIFSSPGTPG
jgi:DNA-binding response OmpR family regulator